MKSERSLSSKNPQANLISVNDPDISKNKLLAFILKELLHQLFHQFKSNNYDTNSVLREVHTTLIK